MILYKVVIGDQYHFTYGNLDRAVWHLQVVLEFGHETGLISESDYQQMLPRVGLIQDRDLPWKTTTEDGVLITVSRLYGVDDGGYLVIGM